MSYGQLVKQEGEKKKKKRKRRREDELDAVEQFQKVVGSADIATSPFLVLFGISTVLRLFGTIAKNGRQALELLDTFVGRYLVYTTVGYVALKFLHFKVFPDFPF